MSNRIECVVMSAAANMPNSCWGVYRRVAVVAVDRSVLPEGLPKMISTHARGVYRVVKTWERLNVGRTDRCAYQRALAEARETASRLNAESHGDASSAA